MRLKKLKITGFKSFADRVVLDFETPIIGIVGPNGCGKSNIVDAFRWVLGEQSAKSLRGQQMQDILFAGSERRKAAAYAEVSITLGDIAEGELSVPYSEVTLTRRLDRDGGSEYQLNHQVVLLRDIQQLFLGTGIGRSAFSIFEQGKLDRVIQLPPTARREIFDEAAGIGRFLERKKETVRKLSSMMENYHRLKDVHEEVDKNNKLLKKQAAQAEQYLSRKQRLEELEKATLLTKLKQLHATKDQQYTLLITTQQTLNEQETLLQKHEQELVSMKQNSLQAETAVAQLRDQLSKAERTVAVHESEEKQQRKRHEELRLKQKDLVAEQDQEQRQIAQYQKQIEEKQSQQQGDLGEQEKCVQQKHAELKALQQAHLKAMQMQAKSHQALQAAQFRLEKMRETQSRLEKELLALQHREQELTKQSQEQRAKVEQLKATIDEVQSRLKKHQQTLLHLQNEKQQLEKAFSVNLQKQTELQTSKNMLEKLRQTRESSSKGFKHLVEASEDPKHALYQKVQTLAHGIQPKKGKAQILDSVLFHYRHTLLVNNKEDVASVLRYAQQHALSDFSLLCLEELKIPKGKKESLATAAQPSDVAHYFLHDLKLSEEPSPGSLTPEGYFVDHKGVLFVQGALDHAPFTQQEKLEQISLDLEQAHVDLEQQRLQLEQVKQQIEQLAKNKQQDEEQYRRQEMTLVQENFGFQRALADLKDLMIQRAAIEKQQSEANCLTLEPDVETCQQQLQQHQKEIDALVARVQECEKAWQIQQEQLQHRRFLAHELGLVQAKHHERKNAYARLLQDLEHTQKACEQCEHMLTSRMGYLTQAQQGTQQLQQNLQEAIQLFHAHKESQMTCEKAMGQCRQNVQQLQKHLHQYQLKQTQEATLETQLLTELEHKYALSPEACFKEQMVEISLEEAEKELKELRQILAQTAAVNLTAIETYAEQSKRFEDLDVQLKDLVQAKQDLEALIAKLDHDSRKLFKQTFAQIRLNFQRNFQTLFGGGEADLTFTESHDVLEAGIDIMAKPPGKQMKTISLLSGGEKCLTALALLFSIFEVKPAPFCILDEVDAPLDESNVGRFTQMLAQYVDSTQFILVTHNKRTMAVADVLIGVSMEEKGVSKLLSMTFSQHPVRV